MTLKGKTHFGEYVELKLPTKVLMSIIGGMASIIISLFFWGLSVRDTLHDVQNTLERYNIQRKIDSINWDYQVRRNRADEIAWLRYHNLNIYELIPKEINITRSGGKAGILIGSLYIIDSVKYKDAKHENFICEWNQTTNRKNNRDNFTFCKITQILWTQ